MDIYTNNDGWSSKWGNPAQPDKEEQDLIIEAQKRYRNCVDWEAQARTRWDYDYKFANGDTHNKYQWDTDLVNQRELEDRPCLTINKTRQHNLMIVNDAKQNKPGIRIRPIGDEATYEAAQIYQELIYHIEYISSAENVYDSACTWQVDMGMGYWRVNTDFLSPKSFDQEIYIQRIKDSKSVYLDPNIDQVDGLDAKFGFIFEDIDKDLFREQYPEFAAIAGQSTLGNVNDQNGWVTRNTIKVAEYYRKNQKKDKLVTFIKSDTGEQVLKYKSELDDTERYIYNEIKKNKQIWPTYQFRERDIITDEVEYFKIAADRIIEQKVWPGKYIPIVRLPGTETVIDGIWDCKGHTRALINAQQIYNYSTSANVEYGALQTKSPWLAPSAAIEGFEEYFKTANSINHSYIPYNHLDEDGNPIPPPTRPQPPQPGPAYTQQLEIAQNEMMMASGQYQSQFGENENAKSGVAINARQRQGDRATYHFIDNQAIAIRATGKIILDLIPKIYDTERIRLITASDGTVMNVNINPQAQQGYQETDKKIVIKGQVIKDIIFNPNVGMYEVQSDTGPSFATKRMEAAAVLTQLAASDKEFMKIGGDIYFKNLDFPQADVLADRYRKSLPPEVTGDDPDPQSTKMMHQAADHIQQLNGVVAELQRQLKDKETELAIKAKTVDIDASKTMLQESRDDYEAHTKRLVALGNSGPAVSVEQIQPILRELMIEMLRDGTLMDQPGVHEGGTVAGQEENAMGEAPGNDTAPSEEPPMPGAVQHPESKKWYYQHPETGQHYEVAPNG